MIPSPRARRPVVLVADDDPLSAAAVHRALDPDGGFEIVGLAEPQHALPMIASLRPHVLVTGVHMSGMNGFELVDRLQGQRRGMRIVMLTSRMSTDDALAALRVRADEILPKPVDVDHLAGSLRRLAADAGRSRVERATRTVLAVGAHPDDVEIGVGATLAAHRAAGDQVVVLTLSRGARGGEAGARQHESLAAAELIGARLFLEDLTDAHIEPDDAVGILERVVAEVTPSIVYTHTQHERHQDHRAVHAATMVATRRVPFVGCYQSPSTTVDYHPNRFVVVDEYLDAKLALLDCYASQTGRRDYLAPDFVRATSRYWSRFGTGQHAEPLEIVRDAAAIAIPATVSAAAPSAADPVTAPAGDPT